MGIMSRFPTKYLKGDDIEPGEIVSIKEVRDEIVGVEQESLPVLYLKEYDKGIVLNKTNAKSIVGIYGDDERRWDGKKLMLVTETVRFKGETTNAIRMRPCLPRLLSTRRKRRPKRPPRKCPSR